MSRRISNADANDPQIVVVKARRHAKCWVCNKEGSEEATFKERLTPLLRTSDGGRYTRQDLEAELERRAEEWKQTKYIEPKCQKEAIEALLKVIDQLDEQAQQWRNALKVLAEDPHSVELLELHGFTFPHGQNEGAGLTNRLEV